LRIGHEAKPSSGSGWRLPRCSAASVIYISMAKLKPTLQKRRKIKLHPNDTCGSYQPIVNRNRAYARGSGGHLHISHRGLTPGLKPLPPTTIAIEQCGATSAKAVPRCSTCRRPHMEARCLVSRRGGTCPAATARPTSSRCCA
jgi:hypothetical protein